MSLDWATATDWDRSVRNYGTVHESVANTDHNDDTIVKQGHSAESPIATPWAYWPFHEDSGSTANDVSGNANDGTISGVTVGNSAVLGTTYYSFDGVDDYVNIPSVPSPSAYSVAVWFRSNVGTAGDGDTHRLIDTRDNCVGGISITSAGELRFWHRDGGGNNQNILDATNWSANTWHLATKVWDGGTLYGYIDDAQVGSTSCSGTTGQPYTDTIGSFDAGGQDFWDGDAWNVLYLDGYVLSSDEVQELYDTVRGTGSTVTGKKTL